MNQPLRSPLIETYLRDVFALVALHAMLQDPSTSTHETVDKDEWTQQAYAWAASMLKTRDTGGPAGEQS